MSRINTNKYIYHDNIVEIITKNNQSIFIDEYNFNVIKQYSWYIQSKGYAASRINGKIQYLHRLIMNSPSNLQIDHINHNKLDNRISNLRIVTNLENHSNMPISKNNKSGVRGVHFNVKCNKWCAQLKYDGEYVLSEFFNTKEDAILARKITENKYYKHLN